MIKIVFIGDVFGKTGRICLDLSLKKLIKRYEPDWVIVNGENVTGGNGLSARHCSFLKAAGADIITSGNHIFARDDWPSMLKSHSCVLRPANIPCKDNIGTGLKIFKKSGLELAVINLAGRVFMEQASCPFWTFDQLYKTIPEHIPVFVDFHSEATSEKQAFFWHVDGRASAVAGTHTHVQTSDERILPGKTAVITDAGMTGSLNSVIGVKTEIIVGRFINGFSERFVCGAMPGRTEGVFVEINSAKTANRIERFRIIEYGQ